jgi:hypothetical protein
VVVGTVDPVTSTADVRTFEHVAILHELRFRRPLEIDEEEYSAFLSKLDLVFRLARVRPKRVPPAPALVARRQEQDRTSRVALAALVTVFVLAAIVVYRVIVILRG